MVGKEDALVTEAGLDGWRTQTTGGVRYFHYRGGHFFLHTAERLVLTKIVEELSDQLARQGIPQEDNDEGNKR
jgi:surfactin synthase thioesterase subunit